VALLLEELSPQGNHVLLATDIDPESLRRAREAVYSDQEVRSVPPRLLERYFSRRGTGSRRDWVLSREVVGKVSFFHHNLIDDPPFEDCDLILCRNVMIYFSDEGKEKVFHSLSRGLRPGGYLFIGGTEVILSPTRYCLDYVSPCFYRKEVGICAQAPGGRSPARSPLGPARL
jgi:chemotaxis protein methyltransferase CheR